MNILILMLILPLPSALGALEWRWLWRSLVWTLQFFTARPERVARLVMRFPGLELDIFMSVLFYYIFNYVFYVY